MKKDIIPAIRLTIATIILFTVVYPVCVWGIAQFAPNNGKGEIIEYSSNKYYTNIGQSFTSDKYFQSRPSAIDYNAAGSGGSNKAPSNKEYLDIIQLRIDTFLMHNPSISKNEIPVDLLTASASGLDPHISVEAARAQINRIAKVRMLPVSVIEELVNDETEKPLFGLFGPRKINVLKLNIALDTLSSI